MNRGRAQTRPRFFMKRVYLDNAATTPLSESARAAMQHFGAERFGNADSRHSFGRDAAAALASARSDIAGCLGAAPEEIYFTSGGTEADNWALKGAAFMHGKGRVIVSAVEHPAVYESARQLERLGFALTVLPVDGEGFVCPQSLADAMGDDVFLVSVMTANNETGSVQPVRELADIAHSRGALFHTDAVQAAGALPLNVRELGCDMLSISAHKFGGPKGFGALYVKNGVRLEALHSGGEQERGKRGGTSDVAGACGTAAALSAAVRDMVAVSARVRALKDAFAKRVLKDIGGAVLHGTLDEGRSLPGIVNLGFAGVTGEELLFSLDLAGIAASNGSACSAGSTEPSRTLLAMGLTPAKAKGAVRFSFGRVNTPEDAEAAFAALKSITERLRRGA